MLESSLVTQADFILEYLTSENLDKLVTEMSKFTDSALKIQEEEQSVILELRESAIEEDSQDPESAAKSSQFLKRQASSSS